MDYFITKVVRVGGKLLLVALMAIMLKIFLFSIS